MPMLNPPPPGEIILDIIQAKGWTVAECAEKLGTTSHNLLLIMSGQAGITPITALAMERQGWSDADHWMRMQASYDLAQARLREKAV